MTPQAAQELTDLIMLDDYVARRNGLDAWTKRWVATVHIVTEYDPRKAKSKAFIDVVRESSIERLVTGLDDEAIPVLHWKVSDVQAALSMHVLRQEPFNEEVDSEVIAG